MEADNAQFLICPANHLPTPILHHSINIKRPVGSCLKCPTGLKGARRLLYTAQHTIPKEIIWMVKVQKYLKIKSLKSTKGLLSVNFRTEYTEGLDASELHSERKATQL